MWSTMCLASRPDTSHQRRAQRVEEEQPDEVETGARLDDAAVMNGIAVLDRQLEIDPVVVGCVSRAPDDVRHIEDPSVLEDGISRSSLPPLAPLSRCLRPQNPSVARGRAGFRAEG